MFHRKNYIIFPKLQVTLILVNLVTSLLFLSILVGQGFIAFRDMRALGLKSNIAPGQPYFSFIKIQEKTFFSYLIISFVVAFIASLIATIIYSHRVAGPVVRLRDYFNTILETGKLPDEPLNFRRKDYFSDLLPVVTSAMEKLTESNSKK